MLLQALEYRQRGHGHMQPFIDTRHRGTAHPIGSSARRGRDDDRPHLVVARVRPGGGLGRSSPATATGRSENPGTRRRPASPDGLSVRSDSACRSVVTALLATGHLVSMSSDTTSGTATSARWPARHLWCPWSLPAPVISSSTSTPWRRRGSAPRPRLRRPGQSAVGTHRHRSARALQGAVQTRPQAVLLLVDIAIPAKREWALSVPGSISSHRVKSYAWPMSCWGA